MSALTLDRIRHCLEGSVPSSVATCAADGTPNVTFISQVDYVDPEHVALSFQFFNKTRRNIQANPQSTAIVIDPATGASYRLFLHYLRTESEGVVFERMRARLAGIASHTGMAGVFQLRGADIYRVLGIEAIPAPVLPAPPPARNPLTALRACAAVIAACSDLDRLFEQTLAALAEHFGAEHSMLLLHDCAVGRLYTVASHGYAASGVGSEIALGDGVIGVAALQRTAIRIPHLTSEYRYSRTVRESAAAAGYADRFAREIPFPGLAEPRSQLAVPILAGEQLLGVLALESPTDRRYSYDDEDAFVVLAAQLGAQMQLLQRAAEDDAEAPRRELPDGCALGQAVTIRHYAADDSVFIGDAYLIKGVAGAIFSKLVREYRDQQRVEFNNRELRLDPRLRLPDIADNLEARLILLNRRLAERCDFIALEKTGRGRFRLQVQRPLELVEIPRG